MKRNALVLACMLVLFFAHLGTVFGAPQEGLNGTQHRAMAGQTGTLRGNSVSLPNGGTITTVSCDGDGFWIEGAGKVIRFSPTDRVIGTWLRAGNYHAYPNLKPGQVEASVGLTITLPTPPPQSSPGLTGTWSGSYTNSRNEPGNSEVRLVETGGKVEGTVDGLTILDGRRTGNTMTWRLETGGGFARGGVSWNMTVEIMDNGDTLVERYTGRDHRTDKGDGGSYTGLATLHRK